MAVKSMVIAAAAAAAAWLTRSLGAASFSNTINLGAILVGLLVVVAGGMFTIRSNVAKVWRENYEGEKTRADGLEQQLKAAAAGEARERELKHAALAEVAALKKTDQTAVLREIAALRDTLEKKRDPT